MSKILVKSDDTTETFVEEKDALCASPIACKVADKWCAWRKTRTLQRPDHPLYRDGLALDGLELATRESPLRKVLP